MIVAYISHTAAFLFGFLVCVLFMASRDHADGP
jgi:hypothetical protein